MGNAQSGSTLTRTTGALDSYVSELGGDIVYEKSIGSARFLKTVKCRHTNGFLVVKIFVKPDPGLTLRNYHRRLKLDREALADIANVYNYQSFVETDKAGYIVRQWVASNLYDRISTRPFLSLIEKKWITFQLLTALRDARNRKVSHGDIKSENILVTSWNWVYLSDFASYKPTYLPLDDPSDFSFFFDTSGRRTCYIAPERFYTAANNPALSAKKSRLMEDNEGKRDGKVTESMDCFSVGCVIAELFLEGAPLFTLSQLFKFRESEYSVDSALSNIEDEGIRNLIKQMISLDPSARPTFDTLLHTSRGTVFPESFFSFLHNYVTSVNDLPVESPFKVSSSSSAIPSSATTSASNRPVSTQTERIPTDPSNEPLPGDSDHRLQRIWADYESVEPYLVPDTLEETVMDVKIDYNSSIVTSRAFQDVLPVELQIPNRDSKLQPSGEDPRRAPAEDGPALIILALVTSNIRNCTLPSSKVRALDVFLALSPHLTDEAKLDRMIPYIVDLFHDDAAIVRMAALRTMIQVLMMVTVITPSNAAIFPEYIIPNVQYLVQDPEVSVRAMYAQCIAQLANTAMRYLEMGQALKAHGTFKLSTEAQEYENAHFEVSYDASVQELQLGVQEHISALLMDPSSVVKRAILHDISYLCIFLGRQKTNDVLLSHMITYLNDRDWLLRYAFFESIVDVAACAGGRSLDEYILPLMIQALSDVEETVVTKVLASLTSLCTLGLFQKMRIWELMSATLGFLYHPNVWVRQGAASFIASAAKHLPESDVWCIVYPSLRHFLRSDISTIDEQSLLAAMKPPVPRQIFDTAVQWAMRADKSAFWKGARRSNKDTPRESIMSLRKSTSAMPKSRSDDDEAQIVKLQQLGMTQSDEAKLLAMRDYITKLANAISSFASRLSSDPETEVNLKTIATTVFLKSRGKSTPLMSPVSNPSLHRISSAEFGSPGAPFEDLRRRLATINGSASSLSLAQSPREPRATLSPLIPPSSSSTTSMAGPMAMTPTTGDRPGSPTESVISTTNSSNFRPPSRLHVGMDGQKAAPAVGSFKTNVAGLLDSHTKMRSDGSPERSGRSSPISMSATIRSPQAVHSHHNPNMLQVSSYDGQEPAISNLLENLYLDNNRELQNDFGPRVHEGPVRRRNPVRQSFTSRDGTSKKMDSVLISHLTSHSDTITGLAVSPDHMFFVSSSDDKTVKIWDTARLERNVTSKPRHTYGQHHAKVKCVCILEGVHCFASAADDGSLHIVRVHTSQSGSLPKYGKVQVVREHRVANVGEYITCMFHYNSGIRFVNLIYATTHSMIVVLDLRTMRVLQQMQNPRHHGPITSMCIDRKRSWIVVGTSTGVLTLWDRRFGLLLKSWHVGVASVGRSVRIHQWKGKYVMVAVEASKWGDRSSTNLVEVWDIEGSTLVETFVTRVAGAASDPPPEPQELTGVDANNTASEAIAALVRGYHSTGDAEHRSPSQAVTSPAPDVRALVVGAEFGGILRCIEQRCFMITGSEDRRIRLWDMGRPDRSCVLSGLESEYDRPTYSGVENGSASSLIETWPSASPASHSNRPPQRMSLITHNQSNLLKSHQDIVTALVCVDSPFRGGVVSGDRAGVIKVWRVEPGE
ncbi:ARM repeat-containing protein [Hymenopellis radicata]|nr:ARM repeat-containing protein [Hymenopellis radicata]